MLKKNFKAFHPAKSNFSKEEIQEFILEDSINIVLVNGKFHEELSDNFSAESGIQIYSIENTPAHLGDNYFTAKKNIETDYFEALNNAFCGRGICIEVVKEYSVSKPLHVLHLNASEQSSIVSARNLIILRENSKLQLFETFVQNGNESIFNPILSVSSPAAIDTGKQTIY